MTPTKLLDTILIERGQRGDSDAIDELLRNNQRMAFMYAMRLTKHVDDAADVVSEGFIRIHRAIGLFRANSSFSTWMFRILRNCFIDSRKKKRVSVVASLDAALEMEEGTVFHQPVDTKESPFDVCARLEHRDQVESAVNRLPIHQWQLMLMYHVKNLTYDEIATQLMIPPGTIKSRLHRARVSLRGIIESDSKLSSLAMSG